MVNEKRAAPLKKGAAVIGPGMEVSLLKENGDMRKEELMKLLDNKPLMAAIAAKNEIRDTQKRLIDAREVLCEVGADEPALKFVDEKIKELGEISKCYGILLEDAWRLTWQEESIVKRHMGKSAAELERLPGELRL
jgi:hypothetical protein